MISVREFAKHIGKSHVWVLKLIKRGIIPQNKDGSIPFKKALDAYNAYLSSPKSKGGRPRKKSKPENEPEEPKVEELEDDDDDEEEDEDDDDDPVSVNAKLNKAKLKEKRYQAKLKKLEYRLKNGELLEKDAVAAEAQWLAEQLKSKLMAIPPRYSALCEGRIAREIEEILTDAINGAMKECQNFKYIK